MLFLFCCFSDRGDIENGCSITYEHQRSTDGTQYQRHVGTRQRSWTHSFLFDRFLSGNFDLNIKDSKDECKTNNKEELKAVLEENLFQTTTELAANFNINDETIYFTQIGKTKKLRK